MLQFKPYYPPLSSEEILNTIKEEDIFSIVIKEDINLIDKYIAPYREDNNAGCYFEEYQNRLYFIDWADFNNVQKNCFAFISKCYNLDFLGTLEFITNYFKIEQEGELKRDIIITKKTISSKIDRPIFIAKRDFNDKDKSFWLPYGITRKQLLEDNVFPITAYSSVSKKGNVFIINCYDIAYAYTEFKDRIKIYRPKNSEYKWYTNCTQNDVGNFNNLPSSGELLIITKSYKDCRVLRNLGLVTIWFQNEGQIPNQLILKDLVKRFKKIVVWFDNDSTGIGSSQMISSLLNSIVPNKSKSITLPPILLRQNIKDPSDFIKSFGKNKLEEFVNKKL
jgi:hypothetical protein